MAITIEQATADKTGATARAYAAQNLANRNTNTPTSSPITIQQATADKTGATARAFASQNIANRANTTPNANVGSVITGANTRPTTGINVTQPQIATGSTMLATDIISKGQADTARAMAEEARVAQQQGMAVPTATSDVIKNILAQSSGTSTNTSPQGTQTGTEPLSVNGITADTLASQRQGIQDAITNQATQSGLRSSIYGEAVDPAQKELNDINARINDEALAGRRRAEAVLTIPGITKAQASDKINEINRVNASQLADLAVVQMAKQGQYDSAREIADRAIDAKLEEQKNRNQALLFTYQENKELFTKAEQRAFEVEQKKRDREYETEKQTLTQISDLALSALASGAPTPVVTRMQKAKTVAEATALGGQYVGKLDREVKLANIRQSNAATAASNESALRSRAERQLLENPTITPGQSTSYSDAASVILGSSKLTPNQKTTFLNSLKTSSDPATIIKNKAKELLTANDASELAAAEKARDTTLFLQKKLKEFYDAGGSTNLFKGKFEKVANNFGSVKDPKQVELATEIQLALQKYRVDTTGTAYGVQEGQDIASVFPGTNKSEGLNQAITQGRLKALDQNIDAGYRNVLGNSYDTLVRPQSIQETPAPTTNNPFQVVLQQPQPSLIFSPQTGYIIPRN